MQCKIFKNSYNVTNGLNITFNVSANLPEIIFHILKLTYI